MGPFVGGAGGLPRADYLEAVGGFDLKAAFPDLEPRFMHFRADPLDPGRVWFTSQASGTDNGLPLPGFSGLALKLRDLINTPLQRNVRDLVFNGFMPTGKCYVHGFGVAKSGREVRVKMHSDYDA